jgi:hypothetical protein
VVPDATTATVLITSWAADNRLPPQRAEVVTVAEDEDATLPVDRADERRLEVFATFPAGLRVMGDLATREPYAVGIGGALSTRGLVHATDYSLAGGTIVHDYDATDAMAFGYAAATFGTGRWTLRPWLGAGVAYAKITQHWTNPTRTMDSAWSAHPFGEAAIIFGRDLTPSWGLDAGLILHVIDQTITAGPFVAERDHEGLLVLGIRHRL